jgi:hypothetical protein
MTDETPDRFGGEPAQRDLFAHEPARDDGVGVADPREIRLRLQRLLAEARAAPSSPPWDERRTRLYQITFPQMANWLPQDEAEQLCFEFAQEMRRLTEAA